MTIYVCVPVYLYVCVLCVCMLVCLSGFKILNCKIFLWGKWATILPQTKIFSIFATYFIWNRSPFFDVNHVLKKSSEIIFSLIIWPVYIYEEVCGKTTKQKFVCKLQCLCLKLCLDSYEGLMEQPQRVHYETRIEQLYL